ncbi:hypothetical protein RPD_1971 [Rhodopseudomonas palustris BisB5]|uniref:EVE domain-containing protein n=1 Tax=Rhodopseudomonas palustris (strain BisB5) TaxID=316057 RepID=Q139N3_RHOPS|nr:hypothetical protein RPD_1971 [Rhodopseudomonas palustris BisB5]
MATKQSNDAGFYILTVNDAYSSANVLTKVAAWDIAKGRLDANLWALYDRTRHKNDVKVGDRLLIYIGGTKRARQHFVAKSTVAHIEGPSKLKSATAVGAILGSDVYRVLTLKDTVWIEPVSIRSIFGSLSFLPKHSKWGATLMGGCKSIRREDYEIITNSGFDG